MPSSHPEWLKDRGRLAARPAQLPCIALGRGLLGRVGRNLLDMTVHEHRKADAFVSLGGASPVEGREAVRGAIGQGPKVIVIDARVAESLDRPGVFLAKVERLRGMLHLDFQLEFRNGRSVLLRDHTKPIAIEVRVHRIAVLRFDRNRGAPADGAVHLPGP